MKSEAVIVVIIITCVTSRSSTCLCNVPGPTVSTAGSLCCMNDNIQKRKEQAVCDGDIVDMR